MPKEPSRYKLRNLSTTEARIQCRNKTRKVNDPSRSSSSSDHVRHPKPPRKHNPQENVRVNGTKPGASQSKYLPT